MLPGSHQDMTEVMIRRASISANKEVHEFQTEIWKLAESLTEVIKGACSVPKESAPGPIEQRTSTDRLSQNTGASFIEVPWPCESPTVSQCFSGGDCLARDEP